MSKVTEKELREWFAKEGYAQQGPILADVIRIFRDKGLLAPPPNKPLLAEFAERYMPHPGSRHCPVIVLGVPLERVDTHQAALNAVRDRLTRYHVPGPENEPTEQAEAYLVLSEEERAKGFVRPVRRSYVHVGPKGPKFDLRDLTPEEHERYDDVGYVKFEPYPEDGSSATGRFWTQGQLDGIGKGCGTETTMALALAETYARDPKFYGATYCCGCRKHLAVNEFTWDDGSEVGS